MERELQELQNFRRKGASLLEYWKFVLHSPTHQQALFATQPEAQTEFLFWKQLFSSIEHLAHPNPDIQEQAEQFLSRNSESAVEEALKEALDHPSDEIRKTAFFLLSQRPLSQDVKENLKQKAQKDLSPEVRTTFLNTFIFQEISNEGPIAQDILETLTYFMKDQDFLVRYTVANLLGGIEKTPEISKQVQHFLTLEKDETIRILLLHYLDRRS